MGIARLILLVAAIWLAWRLVRRYLLPDRPGGGRPGQPPSGATPPRMLRCEVCNVHVPEDHAFVARGHPFCSLEHQQQWLSHNDG